MLQFNAVGLEFETSDQCEQFQMMAFGISCATCDRSDQQCPWERRNQPTDQPVTRRVRAAAAA
jgi:hypothetical protein